MRRWCLLIMGAALLAACAPATEDIAPQALRISAQDARLEARTVAVSWDEDAELRYVVGEEVTAAGYVLPEAGYWQFVYRAPDRDEQLAVTITPTAVERELRPRRSPPGFVLAEGAELGSEWIDSPAVLEAVSEAGAGLGSAEGDAAVRLLLVPLDPPRWIVRVGGERWRVNARTGEVVG